MSQPGFIEPHPFVTIELIDKEDYSRMLTLGKGLLGLAGSDIPPVAVDPISEAILDKVMMHPDRPFLANDFKLEKGIPVSNSFDQAVEILKVFSLEENLIQFGRGSATWYALLSDAVSVTKVVHNGVERILDSKDLKPKVKEKRIATFLELEELYENPHSRIPHKKIAGALLLTFVIGGIAYVKRHHQED